MNIPSTEGFVNFQGYKSWYRVVGDGELPGKLPLVCLHGGPGAGHDYLEPLEELVQTGRRIIFYDQIGCGKSDHPNAPQMWTVDLYVQEVNAIRKALNLDRIHLLGQSWGGMLAMEYALTKPEGLASLILASTTSSMPLWVAEANRLRDKLPRHIQNTLLTHETAGTTDSPQYSDAMMVFYKRHVCTLDPYPDFVNRTFTNIGEVYLTMNGPSEFHVTGTLKNWDITGRLPEIQIPTLVTSGRFDEATPLISETINRGIPSSKWIIFENSSHMAHAEEPELYRKLLDEFLSDVERK